MLPSPIARRSFLRHSGLSLGGMALSQRLARDSRAGGSITSLPFAPKAKRVIWLYMAGGMSHIDTFDNKPKLAQLNGQAMPDSVTKGQQIAQLQGAKLTCLAPQHPFKKWANPVRKYRLYGQSSPLPAPTKSVSCGRCPPKRSIMILPIRS